MESGQKYCRMLQGEHSAILLTFIKLPFAIKIFVLFIFEWPFYTGFTVLQNWTHLMSPLSLNKCAICLNLGLMMQCQYGAFLIEHYYAS